MTYRARCAGHKARTRRDDEGARYLWVLRGRTIKPARDLWDWARWFKRRFIASTVVGHMRVSTIFDGLQQAFERGGFETAIVPRDAPVEIVGSSKTYKQAMRLHKRVVSALRGRQAGA